MKVVERSSGTVKLQFQTRVAALLSLVMMLVCAYVAWQLYKNAPVQQAALMSAMTLLGAHLFRQSMRKVTITIDLLARRLDWHQRGLLQTRNESFRLSEIAEARIEVTHRGNTRRSGRRWHAELVFHESARRPPFILTPPYLGGVGAQRLADEINAVLSTRL